jgi:hypothetical protein
LSNSGPAVRLDSEGWELGLPEDRYRSNHAAVFGCYSPPRRLRPVRRGRIDAYDKDGKVLTYSGEGPGENGKLTKMKTTSEMKDKDTVIFKMYGVGKDGKDVEMVTITYKRKK